MESKWVKFYKSRVNSGYEDYAAKKYAPFINYILNAGARTYREEGCGIATITKLIARVKGLDNIDLFDLDAGQVKLANINLGANKAKTGDIFKNHGIIDCIFSHGVLEHFDRYQIKDIIARQQKEANTVIHYVPTSKYAKGSFGDELLEAPKFWVENFKPTSHFAFNDGKDLCLIWVKSPDVQNTRIAAYPHPQMAGSIKASLTLPRGGVINRPVRFEL